MRSRRAVVLALCAVALASCGGSPTAAPKARFTYGPLPSVSAKMICRHEAVEDIAHDLGVSTVSEPTATWRNHRYRCPYVYTNGTMVLSVKALPTIAATKAYMAALGRTMGNTGPVTGVGQDAFTTRNGSVVSRKDNKVLVVQVGGLPANFGKPPTTRDEVAQSVTDLIFACWRGD